MDDQPVAIARAPIGSVNNTPALDVRQLELDVWMALDAERRKPISMRAGLLLLASLVVAVATPFMACGCPQVASPHRR